MIRSFAISMFLVLAMLVSAAEAQVVRVGPFGGVRVWAPGFRLNVPGPPFAPPFYPSPFGLGPVYGPPPVPIRVPMYPYRVQRIPAYEIPAPSFQMEYYGPGGAGSISVDPPAVVSAPMVPLSRETLGRVAYQAEDPLSLESQLYDAATRLTRSLSTRRDGEPWMTYLAPNRITSALERGETTALHELVNHYNGVVANPRLAFIANLDGFATTRRLLPQYLAALDAAPPVETEQPPTEQDTGDSLLPGPALVPAPVPEPDADRAPDPPPVPEPDEKSREAEPTVDGPTPAEPINPAGEPTDI